MTDYTLASPLGQGSLGARARRLRELLGMTTAQVAIAAGRSESDVLALEQGADLPLSGALAIHDVLSTDDAAGLLFAQPKLRTIDDVEAYERRRLASR